MTTLKYSVCQEEPSETSLESIDRHKTTKWLKDVSFPDLKVPENISF